MLDAALFDSRKPKPSFARWLLAQTTSGGLITVLAISAGCDPAFPRDGTVDEVSCRLNAVGADGDMHEALADAALIWANDVNGS